MKYENLKSIPAAVTTVVYALKANGHKAYMVGGCVRDMILGAVPKDWDVATSATPEEVMKVFPKTIPTGIAHGTVTVMVDTKVPGLDKGIEVTTFRSEGTYTDGRRPDSVKFETDIVADLSRRDFTVNAMAMDPTDGEIIDPFGGYEDLKDRTIRCVGKADERFGEDGLRIIRAIRFAVTLNFSIDDDTTKALRPALPVFEKVSMERKRDEFLKILQAKVSAPRGVYLLEGHGLLKVILPAFEVELAETHRLMDVSPMAEHRLAVLLYKTKDPRGCLERLKLPTKTVETVERFIKQAKPPKTGAEDKAIRVWMRDVGVENLDRQFQISTALGFDCWYVRRKSLIFERDPLVPKQLAVNGTDIAKHMNFKGKAIGQAIAFLMEKVLEDPRLNTREKLLAMLQVPKTDLEADVTLVRAATYTTAGNLDRVGTKPAENPTEFEG